MSRRAVSMPCVAVGAVVGSVSTMLFLSAAAAGAAKAQELDGELLACCAEALSIDAASDRITDAVDDLPLAYPRAEAAYEEARRLMPGYHSAVERAVELPARTPEGLRAKASLVLSYLRDDANSADIALSLARDVVGRAG